MFKQIKSDIKELKEEVGLIKTETQASCSSLFGFPVFENHLTLIERVKDMSEDIQKLSDKLETLLKHFNIEYVEITEKNGGTKVTKKYRKAKKAKKSKHDDDDDDDD